MHPRLSPEEMKVLRQWGLRGELVGATGVVMLRMGLFGVADQRVSAGYVEDYAQLWRFAKKEPEGTYRVLDPGCMGALREACEEHTKVLLAREAAKRLNGTYRRSVGNHSDDEDG